MINRIARAFVVVLVIIPSLAFSKVPSSIRPGAVQKSIEEAKPALPKAYREVPLKVPKKKRETKKLKKEIKVLVRGFRFEGNTVLSDEYLARFIQKHVGKRLSFSDLEKVCDEISEAYRKRGYFLARAFIPPQEVKGGVVVIKIIEGRLGKVEVKGEKHYKARFIKKHFTPASNGVINYHKLLKTLLLLNEYPDLRVHATLMKGERPGTTDILLKVKDKKPVHFYLDYNDYGSRYVSRHRVGSTLVCSNVLLQGDSFAFRGVVGTPVEQMQFVRFDYNFPINSHHTKLGFHYTYLTYKVGKEYQILDLRGRSKIFTADVVHPAIRTRTTGLDLTLAFDYKQVRDYLLGMVTSDDELRILRFQADFNHLDALKGRTFVTFVGSWGIPDILAGSKRRDPRASRLGAGGSFLKAGLEIQRIQQMPLETYLIFKLGGQLSWNNLPVSEQYSIGGEGSVRGFEASEYLGDSGYSASVEWQVPPPLILNWRCPFSKEKRLKDVIRLVGFFDYGRVFLRDPLPGEYKNVGIAGTGCGVRLRLPLGFDCKVDVGFPVGGVRPSKGSANGSEYRVYVQVVKKLF